jgi:phosphatidylinositol kinase/protein kinase (PI-3  family)
LEDYLHLLLPPIVKLFDAIDVNINVRRTALETVDLISDTLDLSDFASRIIQPLVRCIENTSELRSVAMETLASLVAQLGRNFLFSYLWSKKSGIAIEFSISDMMCWWQKFYMVVVQPTKKICPRLVSGGEILKPKKD